MRQTTAKEMDARAATWARMVLAATLMLVVASLVVAANPAQAATTFVVNDTGDFHDTIVGDGFCGFGGSCSLRAAIEEANSTPEADTINFNIPGTGVKTIVVNATGLGALPPITHQVTIDGYTQPGASPNTLAVGDNAALKIELTQTNLPNESGLEISDSPGSVIKGLVINRFGFGIFIHGNSFANHVEGNFIGTDPTGTLDEGNVRDGVIIFGGTSQTVVGGTTPDKRNLISGNDRSGVHFTQSTTDRLQGNYIGTDRSGTKDLGNTEDGVFLDTATSDNLVGGATAGARNIISGNGHSGIIIVFSSNNRVLGNRIGTTANGTSALGNTFEGVVITGSDTFPAKNNTIGDGTSAGSNTIAFNGDNGVAIDDSTCTGNAINRNSIFSNTRGLGINLFGGVEDATGKTANDPQDADTGENGLQNFPLISTAKTLWGKTTLKGKLNSTPAKTFKVQFYSNPKGTNEGKKFIGQKTVTTDASGDVSFIFKPRKAVSVGQMVTATATGAEGTSEFSAPRKVAAR